MLDDIIDRYAVYSFVLSFESLYESLVSMADIVMLSNWPMFMDAAGDVGNVAFARFFFYSFKVSKRVRGKVGVKVR